MKSNTDYILLTIHDCVVAIGVFIGLMVLDVKIEELERRIARQQVQIEHQALDIIVLKGK